MIVECINSIVCLKVDRRSFNDRKIVTGEMGGDRTKGWLSWVTRDKLKRQMGEMGGAKMNRLSWARCMVG